MMKHTASFSSKKNQTRVLFCQQETLSRGHLFVQSSIKTGDFVKTFKPQRTCLDVTGQGLGSREQKKKRTLLFKQHHGGSQ